MDHGTARTGRGAPSGERIRGGEGMRERGRDRRGIAALAAVAALALLAGGCEELVNFGKSPQDLTRERVEFILETIRTQGGTSSDDLQAAICRWWNDKIYLKDLGELERAMDGFEAWQREAGIYPRLQKWEIVEIRPEEEGSTTMLVLTKINGGYRWMIVPKGATISWAPSE